MSVDCSKCPMWGECARMCAFLQLENPLCTMSYDNKIRGTIGNCLLMYIAGAPSSGGRTINHTQDLLIREHKQLANAFEELRNSHNALIEKHNKLCKALGIGEDAGLTMLTKKMETLTGTPTVIQIRDSVINKSFMDKE